MEEVVRVNSGWGEAVLDVVAQGHQERVAKFSHRDGLPTMVEDACAAVVAWLLLAVCTALMAREAPTYIGRWYRLGPSAFRTMLHAVVAAVLAVVVQARMSGGCGWELLLPRDGLFAVLVATQLVPKMPPTEVVFNEILPLCPVVGMFWAVDFVRQGSLTAGVCAAGGSAAAAGGRLAVLRWVCTWVEVFMLVCIPFKVVYLQEITQYPIRAVRTLRAAFGLCAYTLVAGCAVSVAYNHDYMWLFGTAELSAAAAAVGLQAVPFDVPHHRCYHVAVMVLSTLLCRAALDVVHRLGQDRIMAEARKRREAQDAEDEARAQAARRESKKRR